MSEQHAGTLPDLSLKPGEVVVTIPQLLRSRAELSAGDPALWTFAPSAGWQLSTWGEYAASVAAAARGLCAHGLQRGDRIGILAPSSAYWDVAQIAALAAGATVVGLDPHDTGERLGSIVAASNLKAVFVQNDRLLELLPADARGRLRLVASFARSQSADVIAFDDLLRDGSGESPQSGSWDVSRAEDPALIVFTSGTTGEPKAIAYTHRQTCGAVASILRAFPDIEPGSRLACWLPLANLFQRMINLCAIGRGAQTFYVEDPKSVMQHVPRIAPHLFIGVPRFYEKLYAGIRDAIDARPGWRRRLADWAIAAGDRSARASRGGPPPSAGGRIAAAVAERLVLRPLRHRIMGGNLRYFISGSAPMPIWLLERFHALGLPILEAYGLSESIVPVAANRPDSFRFGAVGLPLASSEVRLADDGELLLRGPGVFRAYLGDTARRVDSEGWLASGDYASIDGDGFVTLLGRKSELFKTSTGRRVAPANIEGQLRRIPYVEHAVVFGANRPVVVALLVVSAKALETRLDGHTFARATGDSAEAVREDIAAAVTALASWQRPAGVVLTTRPLSIEDGFLTPNLKLRRSRIEEAFGSHLEALYGLLANARQAPVAQLRDGGDVVLLSA